MGASCPDEHVLDHAWEIEDKQPTPPTG